MGENNIIPQDANGALIMLREWDWRRCDPDGAPFHPGKDLSYVVNRLALDGMAKPAQAVLSFLCNGALIARGDFTWRKYQHGEYYQLDGVNEILKPQRWQVLADLIADEERHLANWLQPLSFVSLDRLEMKDCPAYQWNFCDNRFSTAVCPPDIASWKPAYLEEWYSARNIEVWPEEAEPVTWDADPDQQAVTPIPDADQKGTVASEQRRGRPVKWDWEGALCHVIAEANTVDGLPDGHGAQAEIGRMIASWFQKNHGGEPVPSEIGKRAALIARTLRDYRKMH